MREYFIAGNWKMHKTIPEAVDLAEELKKELANCPNKLMIAPSFTSLSKVKEAVADSNILLGAQNMASVEEGAHTGEVSVLMLKDIGVDVVILGHSERRHIYGETDEEINTKVRLALSHGLQVILCVGETLEERERGEAESLVKGQVEAGLSQVPAADLDRVVIAYEPVWAIGTGKTATPEDAEAIHKVIRAAIGDVYSEGEADKMIIQYGGSVKPDNVKGLMNMPNIDGALVGGAALKAQTFVPIAQFQK